MPRQARIDAPGLLHHIICRGIERKSIFQTDEDRDDFVRRLSIILPQTGTICYAWALIPNHFHLLLKTGSVPIATVMHKLLTGYAVSYNRRHVRHGHLFQNRYKSILCQEDAYLLQLVRYIHLNPLKAKLVSNLDELDNYKYCGHHCLVGTKLSVWQDTDEILSNFAKTSGVAMRKYKEYLLAGLNADEQPDFAGGGLLRSCCGMQQLNKLHNVGVLHANDERILGDSEFVENILADADGRFNKHPEPMLCRIDFGGLVVALSRHFGINEAELLSASKIPAVVQVRSLLCFFAVRKLGMTATAVAATIGISQPAVSRSVMRGLVVSADLKIGFEEIVKV